MAYIPEESIRAVYDHWRKYKVRKNTKQGIQGNAWAGCEYVSYIKNAIKARLLDVDGRVDLVTQAIDHYAKVLLDPDYTWTYVWTLHEFFTRKRADGGLQFLRFIDLNPNDYLTRRAKDAIMEKTKRSRAVASVTSTPFISYGNMPLEQVVEKYKSGNAFERQFILKVRPEVMNNLTGTD